MCKINVPLGHLELNYNDKSFKEWISSNYAFIGYHLFINPGGIIFEREFKVLKDVNQLLL